MESAFPVTRPMNYLIGVGKKGGGRRGGGRKNAWKRHGCNRLVRVIYYKRESCETRGFGIGAVNCAAVCWPAPPKCKWSPVGSLQLPVSNETRPIHNRFSRRSVDFCLFGGSSTDILRDISIWIGNSARDSRYLRYL